MKKYMLFGGVMCAMLGLSSCDESFNDWAAPSVNDPEAALAAYGIDVTGSGKEVNMNDAELPDSIRLTSISSTNEEVVSLEYDKVTINGCKIPYVIKGNDVYVGTYAIDSLARLSLQSQKYETRELKVSVDAHAKLKSGSSVAFTKEVIQKETPIETPAVDPNGYYLLGQVNGNEWNPEEPVWFAKVADGIYEVTVTTENEKENWYKFYGGTDAGKDWDSANAHQMGCDVNGDGSLFNYLNWSANLQTPVINGKGKWKVRLDVNNWTYTINEVKPNLFLTGSNYGWGDKWLQLVPFHSSEEDFWSIIYLHEDEAFKFAPQASWVDDFGFTGTTINDEAGAKITSSTDGNFVVGKAGWYLLKVQNGATRTLTVLQPNVYLMGDAAGEWNIADTHKFTIPTTEDGVFESPAFAADAELRMCVSVDGFDWWQSEFMVFDGKIEYRGRGIDQNRVNVKAGQKVTLNFTAGTGEIK